MRTLSVLALSLLLSTSTVASTINVPADYDSIQGAIDAAAHGDTVLVAPGTYVENIDFLGKAICVRSSEGPELTFIDAGNPEDPDFGSAVRFLSNEGLDSILDGFTLMKGTGTKTVIWTGAIYYMGGGCCCDHASPLLRNNRFMDNAPVRGGGISCYFASPVIEGNHFSGNTAYGAGIYCINECEPRIARNTIIDNTGQGIYCSYNCNPIIEHNLISGNVSTSSGGGIYC
ncbi:MAG: right-handed parallel beta-helix repeat-containing protein, partial [Planctomycetota bacterium]